MGFVICDAVISLIGCKGREKKTHKSAQHIWRLVEQRLQKGTEIYARCPLSPSHVLSYSVYKRLTHAMRAIRN
jgi:hypothetical protein